MPERATSTLLSKPNFTDNEVRMEMALGHAAGIHPIPSGWVNPSLQPGYIIKDRGPSIIALAVSMMVLTTTVVAARLMFRMKVKGMVMGVDDWLIAVAVIWSFVYSLFCVLAVTEGGLGKHSWDLTSLDVLKFANLCHFLLSLLYPLSTTFTRLSIISFVHRLSSPCRARHLTVFLLFSTTLTLLLGLATFLFYLVRCLPLSSGPNLIERLSPNTICHEAFLPPCILAAVSTLLDFIVLALPIYITFSLQLRMKEKLAVMGILSLGFVSCVVSIPRAVYLKKNDESWDRTWDGYEVIVYALLEINLGIVAASCPALKGVLGRVVPGIWSSVTGGSGDGGRSEVWKRNSKRKLEVDSMGYEMYESTVEGSDTVDVERAESSSGSSVEELRKKAGCMGERVGEIVKTTEFKMSESYAGDGERLPESGKGPLEKW